jgi:membrane fusion protein, multidrug efflux system
MSCQTTGSGQRTADTVVGLLSAVCCLLSACANSPETRELAPRTVEVRGELVASRSASLVTPFEATVSRVAVREGAAVNAGDMLVELTNPELDHNLAVARAQREWAEHKGDAAPVNREVSAIVARKKARRDRYRALFATRDVTLQELEDAENDYSASLRDLGTARNPRLSQIEIERAIADQKLAEQRLQSLVIRAPIAGVVTKLDVAEGRQVGAREAIAEVTAMGNLEARAEVEPDLLRVIRPGMNVEVRIMTVPPKVILDKVAYIVPYRSGQPERRAAVVVNIANNDASLQPGTPVMLTIKTQP